MAATYPDIDASLRAWIEAQPLFIVGTAPLAVDGRINVSPKGGRGTFRVTGPLGFAYVDLFGSGIETAAHLRENGRIVVVLAAFDGRPRIVRLHGRGRVVTADDPAHDELLAGFSLTEGQRAAARALIAVDVSRVSDSCGYVVPKMELLEERDQLFIRAAHRIAVDGPTAIDGYVTARNEVSIDGLPGLEARDPSFSHDADRTRR